MGFPGLVSRATSTLALTKNGEDELTTADDAPTSDMDCAAAKVAEGLHEIHAEQVNETADFYLEVMRKAASLNAVKVDREKFLRLELGNFVRTMTWIRRLPKRRLPQGFLLTR